MKSKSVVRAKAQRERTGIESDLQRGLKDLGRHLSAAKDREDPAFEGWNPRLAVMLSLAGVQELIKPIGIESASLQRLELALFNLFDGLDLADSLPKTDGRERAVAAVKAVSDFVKAVRGRPDASLGTVYTELENVSLGHQSKLFSPKRGGQSHTRKTNVSQASAAAALHLYKDASCQWASILVEKLA